MNTLNQHPARLSKAAFNKHPEILPPAVTPPQQSAIDPLLHLFEVESIVGLKKSKLYLLIQSGDFPAPVRLGRRSVRWKTSAVKNWIDNLTDSKEA